MIFGARRRELFPWLSVKNFQRGKHPPSIRRASRQLGYDPARYETDRTTRRSSELRSITSTVARPTAVVPRIFTPSHLKWSLHRCTRGLNSSVTWSVAGSIPVKLLPLRRLQSIQASAKFSPSSDPPCFRGRICSICSRATGECCSGNWQYSQHAPARDRTNVLVAGSITRPLRESFSPSA